MNKKAFQNMALPRSSSNEDLETISRTKLALLFDTSLYEIRNEDQRDKGVDMVVELKNNGRYTNFRFAIQLKSTASTLKGDQTPSFSVEVANIEYLMNFGGMPSYYIIYHQPADMFYIEQVSKVYQRLLEKYQQDKLPKSFSIKFSNRFTEDMQHQIYEETLNRGLLLRNLNPYLQMSVKNGQNYTSVIIDEHQNVYSAQENILFIEKYGYILLNKADFKRLIEIEKQCYPSGELSAAFHFICGQAHYHTSDFFKASYHFKKALEQKQALHKELQSMLIYYTDSAKYSLGMITKEEFKITVGNLMQSEYLGLFLQVEKTCQVYYESEDEDETKLSAFYTSIQAIKNNAASDRSIRMIADAHVLEVEGHLLTDNLARHLTLVRAVKGLFSLDGGYEDWKIQADGYNQRVEILRKQAHAHKNYMVLNNLTIGIFKVRFMIILLSATIPTFNEVTCKSEFQLSEADMSLINEQCTGIDEVAGFYRRQESMENLVAALSLKYELLHFAGQVNQATLISEQILEIIEANNLYALKIKYQLLINNGTSHEKLLVFLGERFEKINADQRDVEALDVMIHDIDKEEIALEKVVNKDSHHIHLFPLGVFEFSFSAVDEVITILNVQDEIVRNQIKEMLYSGITPVVNIFNNPVNSEGYGGGNSDYQGLESSKNVFRVRKAFFDNRFFRVEHLS